MSKFQVVLRDAPFKQHLIPINIKPFLLNSELLDVHLCLDSLILVGPFQPGIFCDSLILFLFMIPLVSKEDISITVL